MPPISLIQSFLRIQSSSWFFSAPDIRRLLKKYIPVFLCGEIVFFNKLIPIENYRQKTGAHGLPPGAADWGVAEDLPSTASSLLEFWGVGGIAC
jgi:hypothetical protein